MHGVSLSARGGKLNPYIKQKHTLVGGRSSECKVRLTIGKTFKFSFFFAATIHQ